MAGTEDSNGALERFLSSAFAAIVTILFSWRILLDQRPPALPSDSLYSTMKIDEISTSTKSSVKDDDDDSTLTPTTPFSPSHLDFDSPDDSGFLIDDDELLSTGRHAFKLPIASRKPAQTGNIDRDSNQGASGEASKGTAAGTLVFERSADKDQLFAAINTPGRITEDTLKEIEFQYDLDSGGVSYRNDELIGSLENFLLSEGVLDSSDSDCDADCYSRTLDTITEEDSDDLRSSSDDAWSRTHASHAAANGKAFDQEGQMVEMTEFTAGRRTQSSDPGHSMKPRRPAPPPPTKVDLKDSKSSGDDATTSDGGSIDVTFSDLEVNEPSSDPFRPFGLQRPSTIGTYIDWSSDFARNRRSWTAAKQGEEEEGEEVEILTPVIADASTPVIEQPVQGDSTGLWPPAAQQSIIKNENAEREGDHANVEYTAPDASIHTALGPFSPAASESVCKDSMETGEDAIRQMADSAQRVHSGMNATWKTALDDQPSRNTASLNVRLQPSTIPSAATTDADNEHNQVPGVASHAQSSMQSQPQGPNIRVAQPQFTFIAPRSANDNDQNTGETKRSASSFTFTIPAQPASVLSSPRHYASDTDIASRTCIRSSLTEPLSLDMSKVDSEPEATIGTFSYQHRKSTVPLRLQPQSPLSSSTSNPDIFRLTPNQSSSSHAPSEESSLNTTPIKQNKVLAAAPSRDLTQSTGLCTAKATSTALARRESNHNNDDVVSAVASAEAEGDNPYIAIARASARAATVATASAAQTVAISEDAEEDIAVVISTSCVIKNKRDGSVLQDSNGVMQSVGHGVSVSVQTKPHTAITDACTQSSPNMKRKLKITLEQPDSDENKELRTLECELPEDARHTEIQSIVNMAVKKIFESEQRSLSQSEIEQSLISQVTEQVVHAYSQPKSPNTARRNVSSPSIHRKLPDDLPPWRSVKSDSSPSRSSERSSSLSIERENKKSHTTQMQDVSHELRGKYTKNLKQLQTEEASLKIQNSELKLNSQDEVDSKKSARTELMFIPSYNKPQKVDSAKSSKPSKKLSHKSKKKKIKTQMENLDDLELEDISHELDVDGYRPTSSYINPMAFAQLRKLETEEHRPRKQNQSMDSQPVVDMRSLNTEPHRRKKPNGEVRPALKIIDLDEYKPTKRRKDVIIPSSRTKTMNIQPASVSFQDNDSTFDSDEDGWMLEPERHNVQLVSSNVHAPMLPVDTTDHKPRKKIKAGIPHPPMYKLNTGPHASGLQTKRLPADMTSDTSTDSEDSEDLITIGDNDWSPEKSRVPMPSAEQEMFYPKQKQTSQVKPLDASSFDALVGDPIQSLNTRDVNKQREKMREPDSIVHRQISPGTSGHKPTRNREKENAVANANRVQSPHKYEAQGSTPITSAEVDGRVKPPHDRPSAQQRVPPGPNINSPALDTLHPESADESQPLQTLKKMNVDKHKGKKSRPESSVHSNIIPRDINDNKPRRKTDHASPVASTIKVQGPYECDLQQKISPPYLPADDVDSSKTESQEKSMTTTTEKLITEESKGLTKLELVGSLNKSIEANPRSSRRKKTSASPEAQMRKMSSSPKTSTKSGLHSSSDTQHTDEERDGKKKSIKKKKKKKASQEESLPTKKGILKKPSEYEGDDEGDKSVVKHRRPKKSDSYKALSQSEPNLGEKMKEKKVYTSVLLQPYEDGRTPTHIIEHLGKPSKAQPESRAKINSSRQKFYQSNENVSEAQRDDLRKDRPKSGPPQVKPFLVNIDFESSNKSSKKRLDSEELKKKLENVKLKAPPSPVEKVWNAGELIAARSQDMGLNYAGRYSMREPTNRASSENGAFQRSKSLTSVEIARFFGEHGPYTVYDERNTHLDIAAEKSPTHSSDDSKAKSLNDLLSDETDINSDGLDKHQSMVTLPTHMKLQPQDPINSHFQSTSSEDRSRSASEMRISRSLNKLSLPNWYTDSVRQSQEIVTLPNTRTPGLTLHKSYANNIDPELPRERSGKPVVIQHWVSPPLRISSPGNSGPSSPMVDGRSELYDLPSNSLKTKSNSKAYEQIRVRDYNEIATNMQQQHRQEKPAREAYIRLKENSRSQDELEVTEENLNQHNAVLPVSESSKKLKKKKESSSSSGEKKPKKKKLKDSSSEEINTSSKATVLLKPESLQQTTQQESTVSEEGLKKKKKVKKSKKTTEGEGEETKKKKKKKEKKEKTELVVPVSSHVQFEDEGPLKTSSPQLSGGSAMHRTDNQSDSARSSSLMESENGGSPHGYNRQQGQNKEDGRRSELYDSGFSEVTSPGAPFPLSQSPIYPRIYFSDPTYTNDPVYVNIPKYRRAAYSGVAERRSLRTSDDTSQSQTASVQSKLVCSSSPKNPPLEEVLDRLLALPSPSISIGIAPSPRPMNSIRDEPPIERAFRLLNQAATPKGSASSSVNTTVSNLNLSNGDGECAASALNFASVPLQSSDGATTSGAEITVTCRNSKCSASALLNDARLSYKTCHNCYTYYCSRECRKGHWERHKRKCLFSRVNSLCKRIIKKIHDDPGITSDLSQMARTGYLSHGRGAVLFVFSCPEEAMFFLESQWNRNFAPPVYVSVQDIESSELFGEQMFDLSQMCKSYNPEVKYVLDVIVVASDEIPLKSLHRREGPAIKKCVKLHLSSVHHRKTQRMQADTLILTAVPGSEFTENMDGRKARELCFIHIQRQLRDRGVSLRHEFPEVYNRLCSYVADNEHFTPITLFPVNASTKRRFMCLIMPNSEPDIDWMDAPDLLEELGLENSV